MVDLDNDSNDDGHVIVSLMVFSATPIEGLADYLRPEVPSNEFRYDLGTTTFDEPAWDRRADRLRVVINELVDGLAAVPWDALNTDRAFTRLLLTLPAGAETIDAETVNRLAEVNAAIWIDA